ncbi:MAG: ferritin family protein [candidate division Zixibacteria bacterium]
MNAFEYAKNMELDGKKYYEEHADRMTEPVLKRIFEELAHDEDRHYRIFIAMARGEFGDVEAGFKTAILETTKNVFQKLKDEEKDIDAFSAEVRDAWVKACNIEEQSEKFYKEQSEKAESDEQKDIWNRIAAEEHKHWVAINNVINFLDRPKQWLEDAEWSNLDNL